MLCLAKTLYYISSELFVGNKWLVGLVWFGLVGLGLVWFGLVGWLDGWLSVMLSLQESHHRQEHCVILSYFTFLSAGTEGMTTRPHEYRRECVVWDHISSMLEKKPNMEVYCQKNTQCTGFDCVGNYTFRVIIYSVLKYLYSSFCRPHCFIM